VREDPVRKGLLYLGTENGLYVSFNDGISWMPLQTNLPHAPVHWMVVQENFNDLVVATYGRGFWILDDITPLQQLNFAVIDSEVHLFNPRPAYRFRFKTNPEGYPGDPAFGKNPPYGASINYYLKTVLDGDVKIVIMDEANREVRTIEGTKKPGINRVYWDLRYDPPKEPKLRTSPLYAPWVKVGEEGWRPLVTWAMGGRVGPLVAPGTYTVKLVVGGKELTQKLVVKKDPNTSGNTEDIKTQTLMLLELQENINDVVDMINRIEWIRKQINDLKAVWKGDEEFTLVINTAEDLDKKLISVEDNLVQMKLTGAFQDALRWPIKLYAKLVNLAGSIAASDFPPTTQQVEVHELFKEQLSAFRKQLDEVLEKDLAEFNLLLKAKNIPHIISEKF